MLREVVGDAIWVNSQDTKIHCHHAIKLFCLQGTFKFPCQGTTPDMSAISENSLQKTEMVQCRIQ
jgi:hypothetical protein